jgi:DNA-binding MarR family transcriptional regulator
MRNSKHILLALAEKERMTYQQIVDLRLRRADARKILNDLIKKKLVHEEGRENWKRGRKLWYTLTKKGRQYFWTQTLNDVAEALKHVHDLTKHLSNPERLSELRAFLHQPSVLDSENEALKNGKLTLEQVLERFEARSRKTRGLLTESLKAIYGIYLEMSLRPFEGRDLVMGITKEGYVCLIPIASLKEHGLGVSF